jgi:cell division protein FtsL
MATLAPLFDRYTTDPRLEPAGSRLSEAEDSFAIPVFPNEDVYFRVKHMDNSHIVRTVDPAARKTCWKMIGYSFVLAMLVIALLLPTLYDLMAGYRMEALRREKERLQLESSNLQLEETKLISPARLAELARMQRFVDPAPENVVYLDTKSDTILAKSDTALTKSDAAPSNK